MDLQIEGRVALVLAGGGGLGGAIARALAAEGARVAVSDVSEEALKGTLDDIAAKGGTAFGIAADLGDLAAMEAMVEAVTAKFGRIDILVNNSGGPPPTTAAGVDAAQWTKYFQSMVLSLIHVTDLVLPGMVAAGWGRIITSTSSGVIAPIPSLGISNTLRSSLLGWSKTLAREVAARGVTVNVVLPGRIATDRIRRLDEARASRDGLSVDTVEAQSTASIPTGRYGDPQEYADVVTFLASARASYVTGSVIRVDGGLIQSI